MSNEALPPKRKGRGYPPEEYKFQPGRSGNPAGRPKGARNKAKREAEVAGLLPSEISALTEANRLITMRDGTKMTTAAAVQRSRAAHAMKGHRLMAKDILDDTRRTEEKLEARKREIFDTALELKRLGRAILAEKIRRGEKATVTPHPDDIMIDFFTMEVKIAGPCFEEERLEWEAMLADLDSVRRRMLVLRKRIAADPSQAAPLVELFNSSDAFDLVNDQLPARYQRRRLPPWPKARSLPWLTGWRPAEQTAEM